MLSRIVKILLAVCILVNLCGCSLSKNNNTKYENSAQAGATTAPGTAFKTTPLPPVSPGVTSTPLPLAAVNLRFVVLADSRGTNNGINLPIVKKTFEKIKQLLPQPGFAIMPGDLTDGSSSSSTVKSQLEYFKKTITGYYPESFFYPGIGNHEVTSGIGGEQAFGQVFSGVQANFLDGYNGTVYYFDRGDTRFFMLNSDHPGEIHKVSDRQLNWLKANIDPGKKHNLFFMHEPPYPTGPHVGSSLDVYKLQRDELWDVIDSSNGPMVFCGHEHFYTRRHINSDFNEKLQGMDFKFDKLVYQVTVGSFGAPLYSGYKDKKDIDVLPISQYHFAVVDINGSSVKVSVYNVDGALIDQFEQNS